jgi:hypothetical protein
MRVLGILIAALGVFAVAFASLVMSFRPTKAVHAAKADAVVSTKPPEAAASPKENWVYKTDQDGMGRER